MLLKQIRLQKELTQSQVANILDITIRHYQHIESGDRKPSYKKLNKLEDIFGLPQRVLLARSVEEVPEIYKDFIKNL